MSYIGICHLFIILLHFLLIIAFFAGGVMLGLILFICILYVIIKIFLKIFKKETKKSFLKINHLKVSIILMIQPLLNL